MCVFKVKQSFLQIYNYFLRKEEKLCILLRYSFFLKTIAPLFRLSSCFCIFAVGKSREENTLFSTTFCIECRKPMYYYSIIHLIKINQ